MRQQHLQTPPTPPVSLTTPAYTQTGSHTVPPDSQDAQTEQTEQATQPLTEAVSEEQHVSSAADIVAHLHTETRSRKRDAVFASVYVFLSLLPTLYLTHAAIADYAALQRQFLLWFLLSMTFPALLVYTTARRSYRRKRVLEAELRKAHAVATIGPLVDTLKVENTLVRNLTKQALIELLPQLRASDGALMGDKQRDILLHHLAISPANKGYRDLTELFSRAAYQRELHLRLSILAALEQVGGAKELPTVERLARGLPSLQGGTVPAEVRQAAVECLPYLQSRAQGQRANEQLLRASSAQDTANDVLLRPANGQSPVLPEQLLRATAGRSEQP